VERSGQRLLPGPHPGARSGLRPHAPVKVASLSLCSYESFHEVGAKLLV
jgi:hypothetical protein